MGDLLKLIKEKSIQNAWICTIKNKQIVPLFGDIYFKNGTITKIVEKKKYSASTSKNIFDAGGRVLTIPQINFHDHIYSRLAKGLNIKSQMNSFINILSDFWWKVDSVLTKEMIFASAEMAIVESIKNGVTYIFDHHSSPNFTRGSLNTIASIFKKHHLRGVLCFETTDRNGKQKSLEGIKENLDFYNSQENDIEVKSMFGMHASFTLKNETMRLIQKEIGEKRVGIHIHIAEDISDISKSKQNYNASPLQRLIKYNLLNDKSILAHGVHLSKLEYKLLADKNVALAINIESNMNNSVGVHKFQNITPGLSLLCGTDGMHANPSSTFKLYFQQLRLQGFSFAESFERIRKMYFDQIDFVQKYFPDFSTLNVGQRADFIVWDYVPPTPLNSDNFWGHLIYGMLNRNVISVYQNGIKLLSEYKLQTIDEALTNQRIYQAGKKLFEYFNKRG